MQTENAAQRIESTGTKLVQIAISCLKLGTIGFGGIAGMVATIENEMVIRRKWIDHQHFMDVLSTSYIIPGPNAVEVVMHCGKERGGRLGLVVAGICYILPAMLICLGFGYFYRRYSTLPDVQHFIFGIRPATTALVIGTVFRLAGSALKHNKILIFLKIGAVLYGSGYVLFAYMDEALVRHNHWINHQQLTDAIAVGQITPGPILSSATFAGYLINGTTGGILATAGIFLPSFFISFFLHRILSSAPESQKLRLFLDGLSAASVSIIAVVALHLFTASIEDWHGSVILGVCLALTLFRKRSNTAVIILTGSIGGFLLLKI